MPLTAETDCKAMDDTTRVHMADSLGALPDSNFRVAVMPDRETSTALVADGNLEARLRMLEQTLETIETRLKEAEASSVRAASLSEHGAAALFQRMESFERQQIAAVKSAIGELGAAQQQNSASMESNETPVEALEDSESGEPDAVDSERAPEHNGDDCQTENMPSAHAETPSPAEEQNEYFAAAQRAATAAATLAGLEGIRPASDSRWQAFAKTRVRLQRKHYALAVGVVFVTFFTGGSVAFYAGQAKGHELAVQFVAKHRAAELKRTAALQRTMSDPRSSLATMARAGDAQAQLLLGLNYLRGNGAALNPAKAAEWIRKAAEQHQPVAQYWLGTLYEHGDGIAVDSAIAIQWYEAAAIQGNRKAMHALGVAFAQGHGVQQNYVAAATWFAKAADLGLVNSQFNLGVLYERGLGVPQSLREAYRWYAVAAAQGDEESRIRIDALKSQLAAQDVAIAQHAAAMFRPHPLVQAANSMPKLAV